MKKLLVALAFIAALWSAPAAAQCNGKFGASTACGSVNGGPPGPIAWSAILGNAITGLTGDGTATGPGTVVFTLANVNSNVGTFGSATSCVVVTANAKGLITAISGVTCTPAFSSLTGQATLAQLPQLNANSIYANFTASPAQPVQSAIPACANDGGHALVYINGTGLQCAVIASGGTVTSAQISAGAGITVTTTSGANPCTTTCNLTVAQSLTNATLQQSPSNPTGSNSNTAVMMGLGKDQAGGGAHPCALTTVYSNRIKIEIIGNIKNSTTGTVTGKVLFGTGTAPSNGVAQTGTQIANAQTFDSPTANVNAPFANGGIITSLTPTTAYWFDLSMATTTGTSTFSNISCNAMEF